MKGVAKVAVSIPAHTLKSLERVRVKQGRSRSAIVTEAIERWLASEEAGGADRRYVEGYLRQPERTEELGQVASAVVGAWDPWE